MLHFNKFGGYMNNHDQRETDKKQLLSEIQFEYDQLRKEILQNDQMTLQIIAFVLATVGAVMSVTFTNQQIDNVVKSGLLIIASFIALVGMYIETERVYTMYVIGSYIRFFIEPHTSGLRWETRLAMFRDKTRRKGYMNYGITQKGAYYLVIGANVSIALYYFYQEYGDNLYAFIPVTLFIILFFGAFIWHDFRKGRGIDNEHIYTFDKIWSEVAHLGDECRNEKQQMS